MTTAEKFVTRRFPEADVYPVEETGAFHVIDDADQNPGKGVILGYGATESEAWAAAAQRLGSKRGA